MCGWLACVRVFVCVSFGPGLFPRSVDCSYFACLRVFATKFWLRFSWHPEPPDVDLFLLPAFSILAAEENQY